MKKIFYKTLVFILIFNIFICTMYNNTCLAENTEIEDENKDIIDYLTHYKYTHYPDIVYYRIDIGDFESFVENPESVYYDRWEKYSYFTAYNKEKSDGEIKTYMYSMYLNDVFSIKDKDYSIVDWQGGKADGYLNIITEDTFKFMDKENIDCILKERGIDDKAESVALVTVSGLNFYAVYPATIWIKTENNNNYYLVSNGDYTGYSKFDVNTLEFMNYEEYYNRYTMKSGTLYIDNEKIDMENSIMFQCERYLYIPFRDLMTSLGSDVYWNQETRGASFICNGKVYTLYNDANNFFKNQTKKDTLNSHNNVPFIDDKMYIGGYWVKEIAKLYGMEVTIDYDNRSIYLNSK